MTTDEKSLQNIETRICMLVGSVHGIVTQAEIAHRDRLRGKLGRRWDAVNGRWLALDIEMDA